MSSSGRLIIVAKVFLKLPNLYMLINKTKEFIALQKRGSRDNSFLSKGKGNFLYSRAWWCCLLYLMKQNC